MTLPELSLRRPVLATVLNLLIVLARIVALSRLPVRELPNVDTAEITVSVDYTGAAPDVVDAQITSAIEGAVAGIAGLQSMSSEAERGSSRTVPIFDTSRNIDEAANDLRAAVDRVVTDLPADADAPEVEKNDNESDPVVQLSLSSTTMTALELSDYADRFIIDRLARLPGVANAQIFGERAPAMRIWLDAARMAAHGVTVADITGTLQANNVELPAGEIETPSRQLQVLARTRFSMPEEFETTVLRKDSARPVLLGDVADVERGAENSESLFRSDRGEAVGIGIQQQVQANTVAISRAVASEVAAISSQLPEGVTLTITTDEAVFIEATITQLAKVFAEAVLLVTLVIFLFLGSGGAGAGGDHPDRDLRRGGGDDVARPVDQYLQPGGPRAAGGTHGQERHPDGRIRQSVARSGPEPARGHAERRQHPVAADPDDHHRHRAGRAAAGHRNRRRIGKPGGDRAGDLRRVDLRHGTDSLRHASGLRAGRPARPSPASAGGSAARRTNRDYPSVFTGEPHGTTDR